MKKVRFETPSKRVMNTMQDYECHSPRPFIERQVVKIAREVNHPRPVVYTNDPVAIFENSNCSPYPSANKTYLNASVKIHDKKVPSSDLDLSILDCSQPKSRPISQINNIVFKSTEQTKIVANNSVSSPQYVEVPSRVLTSIENKTKLQPPNILNKDNDFFLRRENLGKLSFDPLDQELRQLNLNKENNPLIKKNELIRRATVNVMAEKENYTPTQVEINGDCRCHHCIKSVNQITHDMHQPNINRKIDFLHGHIPKAYYNPCSNPSMNPSHSCPCNCNMQIVQPPCHCGMQQSRSIPQNAIDKKTWAIEKYEKIQKSECSELEKQQNVIKDKREPTVSDLFKIIKLQNEQLQLLQEKVDKFISAHEVQEEQKLPIKNYIPEQVAVQTVNAMQHKISIGVMTSFEMVRTSTVINKEIVKQSEAQIQCNRSQISIKEVVSKKQLGNLNFLDGIPPVIKNVELVKDNESYAQNHPVLCDAEGFQLENVPEDKTLNELSLYNIQVDSATTPLMSPDQSLYLDIRDYSESDSGSDDQSDVGWTYYNKVMSHVNGILQDSDMPSSASALYRHTKQKRMQMHTDKSNVSVGKRVTFGDEHMGIQQQHISTPSDTSLKMNQLAAKYLKHPSPRATGEMSFATKNYMQRHKLLQGPQFVHNMPVQPDIPKFLDITALKQQPKLI